MYNLIFSLLKMFNTKIFQ